MRLELLKLQGKEFTGKTISQEYKLPERLFYIRIFLVVVNEDGKKVCRRFLSWLFYSVLLATNRRQSQNVWELSVVLSSR